jgi:catechol 2,3-dioxygenase-like lactoylglutathione lyase family enzyme
MDVSHVILRVSDLERALEFYRDRVGFSVLGATDAFAFLDGGAIRIALNVRPSQPADNSLTEIVLEVDDIVAEHTAMKGRGIPFEVRPREVMRDGNRSLHAAHFADPDGHLWSITGWIPDGSAAI